MTPSAKKVADNRKVNSRVNLKLRMERMVTAPSERNVKCLEGRDKAREKVTRSRNFVDGDGE